MVSYPEHFLITWADLGGLTLPHPSGIRPNADPKDPPFWYYSRTLKMGHEKPGS